MAFEIINRDCLEAMPTLPAASFDLVFTSPPYNLGNTTGGGFPDRFGHYRKSTGLSGRGGGGRLLGGSERGKGFLGTEFMRYGARGLFEFYGRRAQARHVRLNPPGNPATYNPPRNKAVACAALHLAIKGDGERERHSKIVVARGSRKRLDDNN